MTARFAFAALALGALLGSTAPAFAAYWVPGHYGPRGFWHPGHWVGRAYGPPPEPLGPPPGFRPGRVWIPGHYDGPAFLPGHWAPG